MKWLKRKIIKWVREDWENERKKNDSIGSNMVVASRDVEASMCEADPILNFRVFSAVGGRVVEFRTYDRQKDRSNTTTYIISKDDDFGDKIAKIATLESMK